MKIETKYDPADVVWIMINNKPTECTIDEVTPGPRRKTVSYVDKYSIEGYNGSSPTFSDTQIFKTKQELIDSL